MRIRGLLRYWAARGEIKRLPLPRKRASRPTDFYPFIFSRAQIKRLLCKVPIALRTSSCVITPETLTNILLFLYGTGLSVGEVMRIRLEDLELQDSSVKILGTSGRADRTVPLGSEIRSLVIRQLGASKRSQNLFATKFGGRISHHTLSTTFRRLCRISRISRQKDAVYQPRLHDLRHTFAVHRIMFWYQQGNSVQKMLPLLAAYMGMATVTPMEKYDLLVPLKYKPQVRRVG
jgi:integrase/recombinase XerD